MPKNPIKKANSPVKTTGQGAILKKRLLKTEPQELSQGREKILMAARNCFASQGFAGTSMADIQKECGFSRGNLYHHFKTKEEIVQIIITQNLGRFCDQVEKTLFELKDQNLNLAQIIHDLASLAEQITKGPGKGMAFHVWSLAMVNPDIRKTMLNCFEKIRST
jgi:AcrR family transcriptional regulator